MVKQKYADDHAIRHKIEDLFAYRKISDLVRFGKLQRNKVFINHLYYIQTQIYLLDAYLEGNWVLDDERLQQYWSGILQSLQALGHDGKAAKKLVGEIKQYERIERNCRKDKWPTREGFSAFYTTKSCDVRLIRHLVYEAAPELKMLWKENVWKYYDLITEINDDVTDVSEDVHTFNGNRYLIAILRQGMHKTTSRYIAFIEKVTRKANTFFEKNPQQERDRHLHEWILTRADETTSLLKQAEQTLDPTYLASAKILPYMK